MSLPRDLAAALALLAAQAPVLAAPVQAAELRCRLRALHAANGPVRLEFTLANGGTRDLQLLRWGSPFEGGWFSRFIQVTGPQGDLPFQGALRKRGDPSAQDYLLLRSGETLRSELQLSDAFTLPASGTLRVRAGWRWHDVIVEALPPRPRSQHRGLDQDCGEVTLSL